MSGRLKGQVNLEFWFVLAVLVAFLWGAAGIFAKFSTPKLGVRRVAILITIVEGSLYATAFMVLRKDVPISLADALFAIGSCIAGIAGYLCFFESIMEGQVAIAGTISAAYPALTVIGAILLLSERLTIIQGIGVLGIILGIIALSYEPNPGSLHSTSRRSIIFAFLAFALWGLWSLTSKMVIDRISAGNLFAFYVVSSLSAPLLYALFRSIRPDNEDRGNPTRLAWSIGAVALALNVVGAWAYSYALETGSASLVVPISSAYPLVTVVMAVAFLREKINRFHIAALVVVGASLILVGASL